VISKVVGVGAVYDMGEPAAVGKGTQRAEELSLAVVTAPWGVLSKSRVRELFGRDLTKWDAKGCCECARGGAFMGGVDVRDRHSDAGALGQDLLGCDGQERGVDASGIRHEHRPELCEKRTEMMVSLGCRHAVPSSEFS
jgi:hypothetical protein